MNLVVRLSPRVARLIPNAAPLLRLVSTVAIEVSEEWESRFIYLSMDIEGGSAPRLLLAPQRSPLLHSSPPHSLLS
ncbi:MAG TPA: hypothetical protein ENJ50_08890 [Planctomycetaceae bacterium]|nr:hypothetical protein [Planctomycetaceae bacterium]